MAVYIVTGHLGSGKSLLSVRIAHDYLKQGRRVASNITLNLDKLLPAQSRTTAVKLPYIPNQAHLEALGQGYDGPYDEEKFGCLILDEAGTWLNSRDWNDKDRRGLFTWITHARKHGWDVLLLVQDWESLDAQIRRSVCELYVSCSRTDRVKVPYLPVKLPKYHVATARYLGPDGPVSKRWFAKGEEYFPAYDTREAIRPELTYTEAGPVDARAMYTLLSPWHTTGRYLKPVAPFWFRLFVFVVSRPLVWIAKPLPQPQPAPRRPVAVISESLPAYRLRRLSASS